MLNPLRLLGRTVSRRGSPRGRWLKDILDSVQPRSRFHFLLRALHAAPAHSECVECFDHAAAFVSHFHTSIKGVAAQLTIAPLVAVKRTQESTQNDTALRPSTSQQ